LIFPNWPVSPEVFQVEEILGIVGEQLFIGCQLDALGPVAKPTTSKR